MNNFKFSIRDKLKISDSAPFFPGKECVITATTQNLSADCLYLVRFTFNDEPCQYLCEERHLEPVKPYTLDCLLSDLQEIKSSFDPEEAHGTADKCLLRYINNPGVTYAFDMIRKFYA